jgi:phosphatidylglycerophosphate synthase
MNMHRAISPDWKTVDKSEQNQFQAVAEATNGVVTPANVVSLTGLALVCDGSRRIIKGQTKSGIVEIGIGRALDLIDGVVADKTGTKSPLGAAVDATFDKLGMAAGLAALYAKELAPRPVIVAHAMQNVANTAITATATKKGTPTYASKEGKLAMSAQGLGLGLHGIARTFLSGKSRAKLEAVAYGVDAIAIGVGAKATKQYFDQLSSENTQE